MKDEIKENNETTIYDYKFVSIKDIKNQLQYKKIKEILDYFVIHSTDEELEMLYKISVYITNLQDRIKELETINEEHRKLNGELRKENERLREENKHIFANVNDDQLLRSNAMNYAEAQDYKTRNDKAVDMLNLIIPELWNISNAMTYKIQDVRRVLQGKSDE